MNLADRAPLSVKIILATFTRWKPRGESGNPETYMIPASAIV